MTEIKTFYNILTLDQREINLIFDKIADRLDALEGLRGTPKFYKDITVLSGDGIILTNEAGTLTKRVRLNDAGTGLIFEDV